MAVGADLEPGTLLDAYRTGLFPMPVGRRRLAWFSPDPRAVLPPGAAHVSRSLRRVARRFEVSCNTCFEDVVRGCADPTRPHGWIDEAIVEAYAELHRMGWAHSVEVWSDGDLVGGLYGVSIGAFFAGESMFHRATGASKVALVVADRIVADGTGSLFDVQWATDHLRSMGVVEVSRAAYLEHLRIATAAPGPQWSIPAIDDW